MVRAGVAAVVMVGIAAGYLWGWDYGATWTVGATLSQRVIREYRTFSDDVLNVQMPGKTVYLRQQIAVLECHRLSVFADR